MAGSQRARMIINERIRTKLGVTRGGKAYPPLVGEGLGVRDRNQMDSKTFERNYLSLFFKRQRFQWENYAHASHHDLNTIDEEIYHLVKSSQQVDHNRPSSRARRAAWVRSWTASLSRIVEI